MNYPYKRSSSNFAKKIGSSPILPKHLIRSKRTQEAIKNSQEFYEDYNEQKEILLEQQLTYQQKQYQKQYPRVPIEKPSNVITLRNGTQWYFSVSRNLFINVMTKEELSVEQFNTLTNNIAMEELNRVPLVEHFEGYDGDSAAWGIDKVTISPSNLEADGSASLTAEPTILNDETEGVSYTYRWYYDTEESPNWTSTQTQATAQGPP